MAVRTTRIAGSAIAVAIRSVTWVPVTSVRTGSDACRAVVRCTEVTTVPTVVHTEVVSAWSTEVIPVSVVVTMSTVNVPGMTAMIGGVEMWTSEVEVVTMWIAAIDTKVPETCLPVEWTIEIAGCQIGLPLPVEQDIAQVQVTTLPIGAENVSSTSHTHQVVEVDLVCCLVLLIGQIQLVRHLVSEEQGLIAGLLVTHCFG